MEQIQKYQELERYFQKVDIVDVKSIEGRAELRQFIAGMLSYYPWWIVWLNQIREIFVRLFGLVRHEQPEQLPHIEPEKLSFTPGENATFFIVDQAQEDHYWVAVTPKDKHLKAYFGVVVEQQGAGISRFHVFTTVIYLHWTGPLYFNLIRPFHHLVVSRMMKAGIG